MANIEIIGIEILGKKFGKTEVDEEEPSPPPLAYSSEYASIGKRLKRFRKLFWFSRNDIERRTGISMTTIYNLESGRTEWPHQKTFDALKSFMDRFV